MWITNVKFVSISIIYLCQCDSPILHKTNTVHYLQFLVTQFSVLVCFLMAGRNAWCTKRRKSFLMCHITLSRQTVMLSRQTVTSHCHVIQSCSHGRLSRQTVTLSSHTVTSNCHVRLPIRQSCSHITMSLHTFSVSLTQNIFLGKTLQSRGNWEWLYCDSSRGIPRHISWALWKSLGLRPHDLPLSK